jgi:hypothetical protein
VILLLLPLALASCSIPIQDTGPADAGTPGFSERRLIFVFEGGPFYTPVAGAHVEFSLQPPAVILTPASSRAVTGPAGEVELSYRPVAIYDRSALDDGDVIADFPAVFNITLTTKGGKVYEWSFEESLSYARYQDPLYQGLNRDPSPGPSYVNLLVAD